jgi:hypothetical protein
VKDFKYKGYSSRELYSTVRDKFMIEDREINEDESLNSGRTYVYKPIRIKKVNKTTNEVVPFKKLDLDYLNSWILSNKDYEVLEIDNYIYKAIFFPANDLYTKNAEKGYINLKVRLYKNALSCICVSENTLYDLNNNERILNIENTSNAEELFIYPNFIISNTPRKGYNSATYITIENTSIINNKITINLTENKKIYINGKNNYITSNKKKVVNKVGDYIKLQKGINVIKLKSDNYCKVNISYQEEFNIEEVWYIE